MVLPLVAVFDSSHGLMAVVEFTFTWIRNLLRRAVVGMDLFGVLVGVTALLRD